MSQRVDWEYTVTPSGEHWQARQIMNGSMLKCAWAETRDEAEALCKTWAAVV